VTAITLFVVLSHCRKGPFWCSLIGIIDQQRIPCLVSSLTVITFFYSPIAGMAPIETFTIRSRSGRLHTISDPSGSQQPLPGQLDAIQQAQRTGDPHFADSSNNIFKITFYNYKINLYYLCLQFMRAMITFFLSIRGDGRKISLIHFDRRQFFMMGYRAQHIVRAGSPDPETQGKPQRFPCV